ncbi:MAG: PP2C family protein-serine/threonine phosphatase [Spirochaetota bacterium]
MEELPLTCKHLYTPGLSTIEKNNINSLLEKLNGVLHEIPLKQLDSAYYELEATLLRLKRLLPSESRLLGSGFLDEYSQKQEMFKVLEEELVLFLRENLLVNCLGLEDWSKNSREIHSTLKELGVHPYNYQKQKTGKILQNWLAAIKKNQNLSSANLSLYILLYKNRMYSFRENVPYEFSNIRDFVKKLLHSESEGLIFQEIYFAELELRKHLQNKFRKLYLPDTRPKYHKAKELLESTSEEFILLLHQEYAYKMNDSLKAQMLANEEMSKFHQSMNSELKIAGKQMSRFVQKELPRDDDRIEFAIWYDPLLALGGDYYRVLKVSEDAYGIFLADIAGHGISAAMYINTLDYCFQKLTKFYEKPGKLIRSLNEELYGKISDFFITAIYIHIDLKKQKVTYCNAGHPKAVLYQLEETKQHKGIWFLRQTGKVLGLFPKNTYREESLHYDTKVRLIAMTDGVIEIFNDEQQVLGERGLFRSFLDTNQLPLQETLEHVKQKVLSFLGEPTEQDDKTLLLTEFGQ